MASSSIGGNVGTDGAIGPLSGLFTTAMDSQIPSHGKSNNNNDNDNDNGQSNIVDSNLTNAQALVTTGNSDMVARSEGQSPGGSRKKAGTPTQSPPRQRSSRPMGGSRSRPGSARSIRTLPNEEPQPVLVPDIATTEE